MRADSAQREERLRDGDLADHVDLELTPERVHRYELERALDDLAGVVDEAGQAVVADLAGHQLCGAADRLAVGQLELHRDHAGRTGSLETDLAEYVKAIVASTGTPEIEGLVRALVSIGDRDPRLAEASREFWRARIELASEMVERAIARGELPPDTDAALLVEAVIAPVYFRLLMSHGELDSSFAEGVARLLAR